MHNECAQPAVAFALVVGDSELGRYVYSVVGRGGRVVCCKFVKVLVLKNVGGPVNSIEMSPSCTMAAAQQSTRAGGSTISK